MKTRAVLFDIIGTTVEENGNTIMDCFEIAFAELLIPIDKTILNENRGKDKNEMIRTTLKSSGSSEDLVPLVYDKFKTKFASNLNRFKTRPGAIELFLRLKEAGVKLGIGTGMERELLNLILGHLKWDVKLFDYIGVGPELPRQRPHPDMIFDMMRKFAISDPLELVKVGDTVADIQEGKNAGVKTVAVLAGTQPDSMLLRENPDFHIRLLSELQLIIK